MHSTFCVAPVTLHAVRQALLCQAYLVPVVYDLRACCFSCRANAQQPKLFVGMILILIFAEALALYGLIGE